jgi:ferrochelatase
MNQLAMNKSKGRKGVLLVNLGTPDSPSVKDVRSYLVQFLMDSRVIDIPFINRYLLVNGIIGPFRAPKSAKVYQEVWLEEGSPLKVYGYAVERMLQEQLGKQYVVKLAMRYKNPSLPDVLGEMQKMNLSSIQVIPFFPQYASATTGSVYEEVMRIVKDWQNIPEIRFVNQFFDHPLFIKGFADLGRKYMDITHYDHFVFSYHGLPERQIHKADLSGSQCKLGTCCQVMTERNQYCYRAQCFATTRLLAEALGIPSDKISNCFQSRLGKEPWVQPYTEDVVKDLAEKGVKKVLAFSPAFVADCLETTIEVGEEYRDMFLEQGGEQWDLVESLNDGQIFVDLLKELIGVKKDELLA